MNDDVWPQLSTYKQKQCIFPISITILRIIPSLGDNLHQGVTLTGLSFGANCQLDGSSVWNTKSGDKFLDPLEVNARHS